MIRTRDMMCIHRLQRQRVPSNDTNRSRFTKTITQSHRQTCRYLTHGLGTDVRDPLRVFHFGNFLGMKFQQRDGLAVSVRTLLLRCSPIHLQ